MSLVPSLLQAIVGLDGEALVIHVGEKPYVVAPSGQVELATRSLTLEAVSGIVEQLLPNESRHALDEFGAIQYEFPPLAQFRQEHFTVVAARGGDDVWVEIRRRRTPDDDVVPAEIFATPKPVPPHGPAVAERADADLDVPDSSQLWPARAAVGEPHPAETAPMATVAPASTGHVDKDVPDWADIDTRPPSPPEEPAEMRRLANVTPFAPSRPAHPPAPSVGPPMPTQSRLEEPPHPDAPLDYDYPPIPVHPFGDEEAAFAAADLEVFGEPGMNPEPEPPREASRVPGFVPPQSRTAHPAPAIMNASAAAAHEPVLVDQPMSVAPSAIEPPMSVEEPHRVDRASAPQTEPAEDRPSAPLAAPPPPPPISPLLPSFVSPGFAPRSAPMPAYSPAASVRPEPSRAAVVLPISRPASLADSQTGAQSPTGLVRLMRIAASQGASMLYLAPNARPAIRVDGEIHMLDEAATAAGEVEALVSELMPETNRDAFRTGASTDWICDVPEVGRVRCMTFRDHRGTGGIFRMMPPRAISADQLGLSGEVQALAAESEGLVLLAGPRSSGKSTLLSAFVDLINRTRRDHVITIEHEIKVVHESRASLVSQREEPGDEREVAAAVHSALRENPDVLIIEELNSAETLTAALEAASSGRLVVATVSAQTATAALDRLLDLYPVEARRPVQLALAEHLCGIVAQNLLRRPGGGRIAARELLLNTPAVANVIAEGNTSQIAAALESGRRHGMVPLNDALVGFVQSGVVDPREAYRHAADRAGFLALLKRQGVDTAFAERLA